MFSVRYYSPFFPCYWLACVLSMERTPEVPAVMLRASKHQQFLAKASWPASPLCTQVSHIEHKVRKVTSPTSPPWEDEAEHFINPLPFLWETHLLCGGLHNDRRYSELRTKQPILHTSFNWSQTALRTPKKSQLEIVLLTWKASKAYLNVKMLDNLELFVIWL